MDSASQVSLEAKLARNASGGASGMSLNNELWVEYSYASGTKKPQIVSQISWGRLVDREMSDLHFLRDSRFLSSFFVSCTVVIMLVDSNTATFKNLGVNRNKTCIIGYFQLTSIHQLYGKHSLKVHWYSTASALHCSCIVNLPICSNSTQCTAPQVKIKAVSQFSNWCRDGNSATATHQMQWSTINWGE